MRSLPIASPQNSSPFC